MEVWLGMRASLAALAVLGFLGVGCVTPHEVSDPVEADDLTTEEIPLRYIRPYFDGRPTPDLAIIEFLRNQLSEDGTLEYRSCDHHVVIRDRAEHVRVARLLVDMLDYSGLPIPDGIRHLPLKLKDEAISVVPAIPN